MNLEIVWTTQFKKDYKLAMKRHMNIELLDDIIRILSRGGKLPEKNKDHGLAGNWSGYRDAISYRTGCSSIALIMKCWY